MDMIEMWLAMISTNTISVGVDLLLILVLMAMWLLWWKQSQRTQRIESGLLEAAAQLQEATALLDDALNQISLLQRQEQVKPEKVQEGVAAVSPSVSMDTEDDNFDDDIEPQFSSRARELLNAQKNYLEMTSKVAPKSVSPAQKAESQNKQGVMDVAQILRMQREGASLDSIADTLNMPQAQVKLMLMLQKGA